MGKESGFTEEDLPVPDELLRSLPPHPFLPLDPSSLPRPPWVSLPAGHLSAWKGTGIGAGAVEAGGRKLQGAWWASPEARRQLS
ncbi:hypothetical protein E2562_001013 [Oryza meyeriana var. granulata]|uniref:Uncharacterized protein n=1 Tax=Oryza meyeriana var. granulata TaxID=110450 RepID=A0A6G1EDT8_9ORYZ|nr:hypothetical protein E2562_001013 [Oryza meyeriana var. granulata]